MTNSDQEAQHESAGAIRKRPLCGHQAWGTPLPAKSARKLSL